MPQLFRDQAVRHKLTKSSGTVLNYSRWTRPVAAASGALSVGLLILISTAILVGFIFVLLPLWTSVLVRTYAWMVLLGRNGVFNRMLLESGVIADPLPLLNNFTGVLIGMVHVLLPYVVLPVYGAVRRVDPALVAAAEGLGRRFLRYMATWDGFVVPTEVAP